MAWWGNDVPVTLADHVQRMDEGGNLMPLVELLNEFSPMTKDAFMIEANGTLNHTGSIRRGLPTSTWRKLNQGVKPTKSETAPVADTMGNLEAFAEVDKDIADINSNTAMFRMQEASAHVESMAQTMESTMWYGDDTTPERFIGMHPRFSDLSAESGGQVFDFDNFTSVGSGGGDFQSLWFITWDPRYLHGIFPKGSAAGLMRKDHGEVTVYDDTGGRFQAYREHFKWQMGIHMRDYRYVARMANIDTSNLNAGLLQNDLVEALIRTQHLLRRSGAGSRLGGGPVVGYCTESFMTALDVAAQDKANVNLTWREYAGDEVLFFRNIPLRVSEGLIETESQVS